MCAIIERIAVIELAKRSTTELKERLGKEQTQRHRQTKTDRQ